MSLSIVRRIAGQVTKTVQRPARLFYVPFNYLRSRLGLVLVRYPQLVPLVLSALPERWLATPSGKAFCNGMASDLFQNDRPVHAWEFMERSIRVGNVTTDEYLMGAMCLYHGLGRFRDAMSLFARANELAMAEAENRGVAKSAYRVLDNVWGRHIGHTATIDYVIKLGILEGRDRDDTIFYLPHGSKIANRFLLSQVAPHLRLIDNPAELPFDPAAVQALHFDYLGPRLPDGTAFYFSQLANKTYERWRAEGRGPIFKLPPETFERGWAALRTAGVPQGSWFVALHVREGKWNGTDGGLHGILNCDISTYLPAIAEITRRGGWVIRMGDPGMKPLPPLANVIDYCHSNFRADWMDVFIAA
ncbi:MAG TPA: TIGR04372 family glycosyltransferase, partial [Pseudolabrys sp.]